MTNKELIELLDGDETKVVIAKNMKKIGIIILCLLLYACNPVASTEAVDGDNQGKQTEVRETNTPITDYTVTEFANHKICIIDYGGHEYMCVVNAGIVHLESCKCNKL